jgi:hypothetical protein
MFKDEQRRTVWNLFRQHDLRVFNDLLTPTLFVEAAQRAGLTLGAGPLYLTNLVWLGLASALHISKNFADVLTLVLKLAQDAAGWPGSPIAQAYRRARTAGDRPKTARSRHNPYGSDPGQVSEEAFVQARRRMPTAFWEALFFLLHQRFEAAHGRRLTFNGHRLLALDGTDINLPNFKQLREHFGTAANGKGARTVQARMVMLAFPLVRMPWKYTLSPLKNAECTLAADLLSGLRRNDLVLMDRGFWSYGLFWQIQRQQAFFAIRMVKSAQFRTLRRIGPRDRLVCWRRPARKQWREAGLPEAITLRIINYQVPGYRASAVVTSVTDPAAISADQWVQLATRSQAGTILDGGLYHRRWEIETLFCELKVRQGMEGGLRSRTPEGIRYEVAGHVLLYLLVRWTMVEAAQTDGHDPLRLSFLAALRELLDMSPCLLTASAQRAAQVLIPRLLARIAEHQVLFRPGRHYPRPGDTKVRNKGNGRRQLPSKLMRNVA